MSVVYLICKLFIPHESNNQKSKLLHNSSLFLFAVLILAFQVVLSLLSNSGAKILGYAANISTEEVIRLTNEKRAAVGLGALVANPTLSQAAQAKGADMLNKGYWAHVSPDGVEPWKFFKDFGYRYRYAGENLARDFSNASSAVDAWMASPSHKENILSPKYEEIGIAVVEGNLAGVETTIIVQFFGTRYLDTPKVAPIAQVQSVVSSPSPATPVATAEAEVVKPTPTPLAVLISPFSTTKGLSLSIVGLLLFVLVIDAFVTSRKRISRIGGRTFAHLSFLGIITVIILLLKAGKII